MVTNLKQFSFYAKLRYVFVIFLAMNYILKCVWIIFVQQLKLKKICNIFNHYPSFYQIIKLPIFSIHTCLLKSASSFSNGQKSCNLKCIDFIKSFTLFWVINPNLNILPFFQWHVYLEDVKDVKNRLQNSILYVTCLVSLWTDEKFIYLLMANTQSHWQM